MPEVWAAMREFTETRGAATRDEIWFVEHPPVFTLGLAADRAHLLDPGEIDVVQTDRGGQVTYHGPGQLVCYVLIDLKRRGLDIRRLVEALEGAVVDTVATYGIEAYPRRDAPGVYVDGSKIAAVGLKVRRGCSYHGLAFNIAMDLEPFGRINPCGFEGLSVTQLSLLCPVRGIAEVRPAFEKALLGRLGSGAARP
jgi:lipoyl(octanoyl) transferase